jgi:hypothetical protein
VSDTERRCSIHIYSINKRISERKIISEEMKCIENSRLVAILKETIHLSSTPSRKPSLTTPAIVWIWSVPPKVHVLKA